MLESTKFGVNVELELIGIMSVLRKLKSSAVLNFLAKLSAEVFSAYNICTYAFSDEADACISILHKIITDLSKTTRRNSFQFENARQTK